jgi:hypothetical protein
VGTGRDAHSKRIVGESRRILGGGDGPEPLQHAIALALLACTMLGTLEPSRGAAFARRGA